MVSQISTLGALVGLILAIILIIKKVHPAYSLILGALVGGVIGGAGLAGSVSAMVTGAQGMMSPVLRIMTSGILAGALIKTGSAETIAETIVKKLGEKRAVAAIAIAKKANLSKTGILLAMIGGGKAGNIISPNPNTIAASEAFQLDLTALMAKNIIPALVALVVSILLAGFLAKKVDHAFDDMEEEAEHHTSVPFFQAILGPVVVIALLALRSLVGVSVDPLIALPIGGLVTILVTGHSKHTVEYTEFGLSKVIGVSILLIGTGTIAGIIKASSLQVDMIHVLEALNMPSFVLAPLSGILMGAATASTTAGSTIASQTFAAPLVSSGVPAVAAAAMIHAGATVLDSLPHGSFFHATGGSVFMSIEDRMKLIPYEALVGLTSTIVAVILYLLG